MHLVASYSQVLLAATFLTLAGSSAYTGVASPVPARLILTAAVTGGQLPSLADARGSKRHRGRRTHRGRSSNSVATTWDIAFAVLVLIATFIFLAAWCCAVDGELHTSTFRTLLLLIVLATICLDFGLVGVGRLKPWAAPVLLIVGVWGSLDAALRFPLVKTPCSWFGMKHLFLLILRVVIYVFAFDPLSECKIWFCTVALVHILVFPLAYIVALPLHESEEKQRMLAENVVDVDILQRVAMLAKPSERRSCMLHCRRSWWGIVGVPLAFVSRSPRLSKILVRIFPAIQKDTRFRPRSI